MPEEQVRCEFYSGPTFGCSDGGCIPKKQLLCCALCKEACCEWRCEQSVDDVKVEVKENSHG